LYSVDGILLREQYKKNWILKCFIVLKCFFNDNLRKSGSSMKTMIQNTPPNWTRSWYRRRE
jgi:hypothetical protein